MKILVQELLSLSNLNLYLRHCKVYEFENETEPKEYPCAILMKYESNIIQSGLCKISFDYGFFSLFNGFSGDVWNKYIPLNLVSNDNLTDFIPKNHKGKLDDWLERNCEQCLNKNCDIFDRFNFIDNEPENPITLKEVKDLVGLSKFGHSINKDFCNFIALKDVCNSFKKNKDYVRKQESLDYLSKKEFTHTNNFTFIISQCPEKLTIKDKIFERTYDFRYDLKELESDIVIDKKEREAYNEFAYIYSYYILKVKDMQNEYVYVPYINQENRIETGKLF